MIAETERLILRQLEPTDLPFMVELFGSLEVMRFSLTGPLVPIQAEEILNRFLQSYATQSLCEWGVVEKASGQLIGLCGFLLRSTDMGPGFDPSEWELSYRFLPVYWGQGFATEAALACSEVAFQSSGLINYFVSLIEPENVASIRVAEKVGLQRHSQLRIQGLNVVRFVRIRGNNS